MLAHSPHRSRTISPQTRILILIRFTPILNMFHPDTLDEVLKAKLLVVRNTEVR